jgi:hypothetical protein
MSCYSGFSEFVGAQQRRDHVDRHAQRGGGVDQTHDHGSDPAQKGGVGGEQAEYDQTAGDVEDIGHGSSPVEDETAPGRGGFRLSRDQDAHVFDGADHLPDPLRDRCGTGGRGVKET